MEESDDDEEDTVEEDIGDFSVGQERMKMQSQIKSQMEMEMKAAGRQLIEKRKLELQKNKLVYLDELDEDPDLEIDDEYDDMDVSENPGNSGISPHNLHGILTHSGAQ